MAFGKLVAWLCLAGGSAEEGEWRDPAGEPSSVLLRSQAPLSTHYGDA
jgi:hypothetical protein